jgi:hypothetical protein
LCIIINVSCMFSLTKIWCVWCDANMKVNTKSLHHNLFDQPLVQSSFLTITTTMWKQINPSWVLRFTTTSRIVVKEKDGGIMTIKWANNKGLLTRINPPLLENLDISPCWGCLGIWPFGLQRKKSHLEI